MFNIVKIGEEAFLSKIRSGALGCETFADAILQSRQAVALIEKEYSQLTSQSFIGVCVTAFTVTISATVSPLVAIVPLFLTGGAMASAWKDWSELRAEKLLNAQATEKLLMDATADEWADLASRCTSPDHFFNCLNAGLVAAQKSGAIKGSYYHAALDHAHGTGVALPEEYQPQKAVGFAKPKSLKSWREGSDKDFESDPTDAELAIVAKLCRERAGCTAAIIERAIALKKSNKAAATNLLITSANISQRDYKAGGIEPARLKVIKRWAADGDRVLTESPVVVTPVATLSEMEPIAVEPSFFSTTSRSVEVEELEEVEEVKPIAVKPLLFSTTARSVEVEEVEEVEEELEEVKPIAVKPLLFSTTARSVEVEEVEEVEEELEEVKPIAVKPSFSSVASIAVAPSFYSAPTCSSSSIWTTTDLETIDPSELSNINKFPFVMVVAGQGSGKTVTMAYIFEQLSGAKALFTPKTDDHLNPSIKDVYDLKFGFNPVNRRGAWFGSTDSFENGSQMDLDWYFDKATNKSGSALDFLHAAYQTAENRTAQGTKKGRRTWRVFYDEAAQTYTAGFTNVIGSDGMSLGRKGEGDCQWFISSKLKPAIFNFRGAGVQLFVGCQSETVDSIGLKGCSEARDEAWHLYPGNRAIDISIKFKQSKLTAFLKRAIADGYAVAILEKEGTQFKIIRMPKLAELKRFDPVEEVKEVEELAIEPEMEVRLTTAPIAPIAPIAAEPEYLEDDMEDAELEEADWIEQILNNPTLSTKQKKALIILGQD